MVKMVCSELGIEYAKSSSSVGKDHLTALQALYCAKVSIITALNCRQQAADFNGGCLRQLLTYALRIAMHNPKINFAQLTLESGYLSYHPQLSLTNKIKL